MSVICGTLFLTNEDGTMHLATSQKIARIKPPIRRNGKAMFSPNISMVVLSTPPYSSFRFSFGFCFCSRLFFHRCRLLWIHRRRLEWRWILKMGPPLLGCTIPFRRRRPHAVEEPLDVISPVRRREASFFKADLLTHFNLPRMRFLGPNYIVNHC